MYVSKACHTLAFKCLLGSIIYTALQKNLTEKGKIQMLIMGMVIIHTGRRMTHLL